MILAREREHKVETNNTAGIVKVALSNGTKTGQICVLQQLSRVKISWHIIYTFLPKATGVVVPFPNHYDILWNFCLFMVL